jgi:hypothetical protein
MPLHHLTPPLPPHRPALEWTWRELASRILTIRDVRNQTSPVFTLHKEPGAQAGMLGGRGRATVTNVPKVGASGGGGGGGGGGW